MKKIISILTIIISLITLLVFPVSAKEISTETEYFENGYYCITETEETTTTWGLFAISTKSGSRTRTYYNGATALFALTVHGTFNYNGTVARSTASSYSYSIYNNNWSFVSGSSSYSANYATATGTFRLLGVSNDISATLYCDQDGNLY